MFGASYYVQSYLPPSFYTAFGLSFATLIFALLSFLSPYWIESYDIVHSDFVRIGVWMVCFNNYIHPRDDWAREFSGCFWMYDPALGDMWFYVNPWWLVGVQVILTVAVGLHLLCFLAYCCYFWCNLRRVDYRICLTTSCGIAQLGAGVCWAISIILYGIESQNRAWMPRPDQNLISWSYWSANLACVCALGAAGACLFQTKELKMLEKEEERARLQMQNDPFLQPTAASWMPGSMEGGAEVGVLDIGALPQNYEKESHGIIMPPEPGAVYMNSQSQLNMAGTGAPGQYPFN